MRLVVRGARNTKARDFRIEGNVIENFDGKTPRIAELAFVHPSAHIIGDVEIGEGSIVWPGAVIRGDFGSIRLGRGVFVEDNCVLHGGNPLNTWRGMPSSLDIGDNVVIGHGAVVNGKRIGSNVLIGISASILHDVEIADYCIIAAGAVVMMGAKIPIRSFVAGVPAEVRGELRDDQLMWVEGHESFRIELIRKLQKPR